MKSRKTIGRFPSWSDIFRPKYAARCCCAIVAGSCACRHPLEWQLPQRERQQVINWGQKMLILFHSLHGCRMKRECCCFCCCFGMGRRRWEARRTTERPQQQTSSISSMSSTWVIDVDYEVGQAMRHTTRRSRVSK
ncbi:uncharacterized protein BO72DRAFT_101542 [Aspergillus fijiensis CBS 313.89]|uniref:Uncharacterized protein n=1 Tax=Aspergillus fijiensis CBS 313.89 TaxID=1448319 RepID=A0A8G1RSQ2_9EURO|nr:uncharacterized protein BO72DRAFT_101542 [Aspergillus fijiensis CBS 313.89]RAK77603.1 hypothetical protein BO72DRAFT_101542 [Aspergillus fijiensis CBS 313.89]